MTEKKIQRNLHHGGNIEIFAPGVVQIWNDFNDDVVIFALGVVQIFRSYSRFGIIFAPGVVQYFYEGGSNLDP